MSSHSLDSASEPRLEDSLRDSALRARLQRFLRAVAVVLLAFALAAYSTEYLTHANVLRDPFRGVVGQFLSRKLNFVFIVGSLAWVLLGPLARGESRLMRFVFLIGGVLAYVVFCAIPKELPIFWASRPGFTNKFGDHSGFPSGHTLPAFILAGMVSSVSPRFMPFAFLGASLIGWSRVLVGAHFAWQVCSSALIGAALGTFLLWKREGILERKVR